MAIDDIVRIKEGQYKLILYKTLMSITEEKQFEKFKGEMNDILNEIEYYKKECNLKIKYYLNKTTGLAYYEPVEKREIGFLKRYRG